MNCGKAVHIAALCTHCAWNKSLYAVDEAEASVVEHVHENYEELQAWCLLEASEKEQCPEVMSGRNKGKLKKSVHDPGPKKVIDVRDRLAKVRVTMDTGLAGCVRRSKGPLEETHKGD